MLLVVRSWRSGDQRTRACKRRMLVRTPVPSLRNGCWLPLSIDQCRRATALFVLFALHGCGGSPPAYTSDEDDADMYADIAIVARRALGASHPMYIHPYLAVINDDAGLPRADLTEFEYEPSAALDLLQRQDTTLRHCQVGAQGMCAEDYVVFSQIARLGDRDAVVVVQSVRSPRDVRALVVRLRYGREGWKVSGSELITQTHSAY